MELEIKFPPRKKCRTDGSQKKAQHRCLYEVNISPEMFRLTELEDGHLLMTSTFGVTNVLVEESLDCAGEILELAVHGLYPL
jgi:hypothetical protein